MPRPRAELSVGRVARKAGGENIPRLYTRTGDRGETGLAGGTRVGKDTLRIRAYGAYDELGSWLGLTRSLLPDTLGEIRELLERLGHELFVAQAELARSPGAPPRPNVISERHVQRLEREIDAFSARHPPVRSFVIPGGSTPASALHVARTIARRAERELVALDHVEPVDPILLSWANRLSDLLFALALAANQALGVAERTPDYTV